MKALVLFYSRTGTTRAVAEKIAGLLRADVEEVVDLRDRSGVKGYVLGGRDALRKHLTEIEPLKHNSTDYELVVIGTPVWAGLMAPAIRTVLANEKGKLKKIAIFTTQSGAREQNVFAEMEEFVGLKAVGKVFLTTKEVKGGGFEGKLEEFVKSL